MFDVSKADLSDDTSSLHLDMPRSSGVPSRNKRAAKQNVYKVINSCN